MKAVLIVHNTALDRDIGELLDSVGVRRYTKFPNILGRGELSEPHLNIEVWPETNCGTFIVTEESKAKEIMELVRRMRKTLGSEGIKAFVWEIIDVT